MQTENIGIPTLRSQTKLYTTDKEKADTWNEQFLSMFTLQKNMNVLDKGQSLLPDTSDHNISTAGV